MEDRRRFDDSLKKIKPACDIAGLYLGIGKYLLIKSMFIFNFVSVNIAVTGGISYIFQGIAVGKNFIELTYGGPCIICCILGNFKACSATFKNHKVLNLFETLRKLEVKSRESIFAKVYDEISEQDVGFLHRLVGVLNVSYVFLIGAFTFNPAIITGYTYWGKGEVDLKLPYYIYYPFDEFNIKYWPYVYVQQVWSGVVSVVWLAAGDYIFYVCCTYITVQFRFLEYTFEQIVTADTTKEDFRKKFVELVECHQELIHCAETLEDIYSKSTLCNFVSSSLMICLTGFDVMMINDPLFVMSFVSFLGTSMGQIYFFCFFGDRLMRSSEAVGNGAYRSLWFEKDASYGKALLLIMIRSQKACKLSAYGFADVNLLAFSRVLSNAWSYFALLNTMLS